MGKIKNKDLPAFASVAISGGESYQQDGVSKREYFAGLAMQGVMTHANLYQNGEYCHDYYAKMCVEMSDALLKELEIK